MADSALLENNNNNNDAAGKKKKDWNQKKNLQLGSCQ